ncbi:lytic transglycosylase domain-containing protein [Streptomyces sp. SDr-06]|uniref:aggregation-promoting factor C-terminal-like domain-containing protein n=1 Tax=Streptomyces sp. SDr-06 TaxID=2267702 RepID=UPI000DEBB769|nr:transglycosylase SLT domain-containing protein [Streptomyces sp. SDr-06]RCH69972.1 lytic transglycosylase domain-containing protein [Streptomyces sp. SDr-06]
MSRIPIRGFAVASATAVTAVGAVVGVAAGSPAAASNDNVEATAADTTLLADIPAGQQVQVQTTSLAQQANAQSAQANAAAKKSAEEAARLRAAQDAKAKKSAADKDRADKADKDAKARDLETQAASRSTSRTTFQVQSSYSVSDVQAIARQIIPAGQFQCFSNIVNNESSWNYRATNGTAYGLVQALPGSKMSSVGSDWQTNPATQIKWGLNYMNERYGSPCGAWSYWQAHDSY